MAAGSMTLVAPHGARYALTWRGKPYGFDFSTAENAESFIKFVGNITGLDPRHQSDASLKRLGKLWEES